MASRDTSTDILDNLLDLKGQDGTFRLDMRLFQLLHRPHDDERQVRPNLFGGPPRQARDRQSLQREMDHRRIHPEVVTEEVVHAAWRKTLHKPKRAPNILCLAGGVALNCVVERASLHAGRPLRGKSGFSPAAGDAGGAIGAAAVVWHEYEQGGRQTNGKDFMRGSYLGPNFYGRDEIRASTRRAECRLRGAAGRGADAAGWPEILADRERRRLVLGAAWSSGRRALGGRSIIGTPKSEKMQTTMNLKIKYRESFRPFAPSVLARKGRRTISSTRATSPYMLIVAPVREALRLETDRRTETALRYRQAETQALRTAGDHPRSTILRRMQTVQRGYKSPLSCAAEGIRGAAQAAPCS